MSRCVTSSGGVLQDKVRQGEHESFWKAAGRVANELGTPFYVYLPDRLRTAYQSMTMGAESWGDCHVAYSLKTNPLFELLRDLQSLGSWIEVVSAWECTIAKRAGFPGSAMTLSGPVKTGPLGELPIEKGTPACLNIDSMEELGAIHAASHRSFPTPVGVRICMPGDGSPLSRFGLEADTGEADTAITRIRGDERLRLRSVQIHLGTQIRDPREYVRAVQVAREMWRRLALDRSVRLNLGGGFPYDHDRPIENQRFDPRSFFAELGRTWGTARPVLVIEPGRWIAAPSVALVARVASCKRRRNEPTIVVIDSGTNHNVMGAFHEHEWWFPETEAVEDRFRMCGPLCMEDDIMSGPMTRQPPKVGSLVAMRNAGAYSLSLSRTFIQPRPPVVTFEGDSEYRVLVGRETPDLAYSLGPHLS